MLDCDKSFLQPANVEGSDYMYLNGQKIRTSVVQKDMHLYGLDSSYMYQKIRTSVLVQKDSMARIYTYLMREKIRTSVARTSVCGLTRKIRTSMARIYTYQKIRTSVARIKRTSSPHLCGPERFALCGSEA